MAATCSHKDETRKSVSSTAHGVAFMRSLEATVEPELQLFHDPYADALAGEVGRKFVEDKHGKPSIHMINTLSVRTKRIDDEFESSTLKQVCVFGAGLDTRPWRLKKTVPEPVKYFEIDFAEVFALKLHTLEGFHAVSEFEYHPVVADLSVSAGWPESLLAAGFDPTVPTFFILEGFVNYLTLEEVTSFFTTLSNSVAAKGSRVVLTCATPTTQTSSNLHGLHRFFPEDPLAFFDSFGWKGRQELVEDLAKAYNRPVTGDSMNGYYIVTAELVQGVVCAK